MKYQVRVLYRNGGSNTHTHAHTYEDGLQKFDEVMENLKGKNFMMVVLLSDGLALKYGFQGGT